MSKNIYRFIESEMMRLSFSEVNDLTYVSDTVGNILFVNNIVEKFTGNKPEVYYSKPFTNLFHDQDRNKLVHAHISALQGKNSRHECSLSGAGRNILCEVRNNPLKDETGNIIGVIGIARDITSRKMSENKLKVLNKSLEQRVVDYTMKLVEVNIELTEEMQNSERLERELKNDIGKLHKAFADFMKMLALSVESRNVNAVGHHKSVSKIACSIAEEMMISRNQIDNLRMAAMIHDIGKISLPAEIVSKTIFPSDSEYSLIKKHPVIGYEIINKFENMQTVAEIVLQHHENIDGSGYPMGLTGETQLLESKILNVANVIDSIFAGRKCDKRYDTDSVLNEISRYKGVCYDPDVVDACMAIFNRDIETFRMYFAVACDVS